VFKNGTKHLERWCKKCGAFNKYAPQEIDNTKLCEHIMPFGKHKGKSFGEILSIDYDYMCWCVDNLDNRIGDRIRLFLDNLKTA
jgi:uncharacterized protein (DUF3820 family)